MPNPSITPAPEPRTGPAIRRLQLAQFRSYPGLDLRTGADMVILTGENGAGKTNVLEAISLLTAGRGLRRAAFDDCARQDGPGSFAISAEISGPYGPVQLGTGIEAGESGSTRKYRIDREPVSSVRAFADHIRIVWLTPAMDGLFTGPPGDRRRFLDRLVLAIDVEHGARVNAMDRALRNRNRLLENGARDTLWLDAAEREVAELGIAIAAARQETIARLAALIEASCDEASPFAWAGISLEGEIDSLLIQHSALDAEDIYRRILKENRHRDAAAGRTLTGPQASDLAVKHGPKGLDAARCSTGEQKALLVGLILAHARLVAAMSGLAPVVLLDEVAAHFDPRRRVALYERLARLGAQVWMTGADIGTFAGMPAGTDFLQVSPGKIERLAALSGG